VTTRSGGSEDAGCGTSAAAGGAAGLEADDITPPAGTGAPGADGGVHTTIEGILGTVVSEVGRL
jgi:hypothetical protein